MLFYIDVRLPNLLPFKLIASEAQDFGPQISCAESLIPIKDALADLVSQSRKIHRPVEEPQAPVQTTEQAAVESVNSSDVEAGQGEGEMVVKRTMTLDCFMPSACPAAQQQAPQGRSQTPSPPPPARSRKRQGITDQPSKGSRDAPPKTPPARTFGGIVIWEPVNAARPTAQMRSNVASFSWPEVGWQAVFRLRNEPFPVTASVRTWAQGEGGGSLRVWRRVFYCLRMYTSSRVVLMSP